MDKIEIVISDEELEILNKERKNNKNKKVRDKASSLYFRARGYTEKEIKDITGLAVSTILTHVKRFKNEGINYIYTTNYRKNKPKLEPYTDIIIEDFKKENPQTIDEAIIKVKELTGVDIKRTTMRTFLKKTNLHIKNQEVSQQKQTKNNNKYFWTPN